MSWWWRNSLKYSGHVTSELPFFCQARYNPDTQTYLNRGCVSLGSVCYINFSCSQIDYTQLFCQSSPMLSSTQSYCHWTIIYFHLIYHSPDFQRKTGIPPDYIHYTFMIYLSTLLLYVDPSDLERRTGSNPRQYLSFMICYWGDSALTFPDTHPIRTDITFVLSSDH